MSAPKRFFVPEIGEGQTEIILSGEEFTHAKTVLRVEEGSEIVALDGTGKEYSAIVTNVEKKQLSAHITGAIEGSREPKTPIYLLCGLLKGDKTELVVQKACELGVHKIGVFSSKYCSAYINGNKLERLNKISREAAKQCLRSVAPEVVYFSDLRSALASASGYKNKLFFCEFEPNSQCDFGSISGGAALVTGSEGGFSEDEYALAQQCGFLGMSLGKRILRAETAAVSAVAVAAYVLGELK